MNMSNTSGELPSRVDPGPRGPVTLDLDFRSAARSDACVLFTGRENAVRAVAYRVHRLSRRRQRPFAILHCGWSAQIVEPLLFGVFTGTEATGTAEPYEQLPRAGTVLVQEIGRLAPSAQSRLAERLVCLCEQRHPGSSRWRLMASTSEPLLPRVLDGTFDDRLYYRLNVIHVVIPGDGTGDAIGGAVAGFTTGPRIVRRLS